MHLWWEIFVLQRVQLEIKIKMPDKTWVWCHNFEIKYYHQIFFENFFVLFFLHNSLSGRLTQINIKIIYVQNYKKWIFKGALNTTDSDVKECGDHASTRCFAVRCLVFELLISEDSNLSYRIDQSQRGW